MTSVRPSQTAVGKAWIENFSASRHDAATLLLDSLRIVTYSELRGGLIKTLYDLRASDLIPAPALVVPVLSEEDMVKDGARAPNVSAEDIRTLEERPFGLFKPVAFDQWIPGGLPTRPGSEALVAQMLTADLPVDLDDASWLFGTHSLDSLRQARCRAIVLVTDYVGSGKQIADCVMALVRNKTIRSWRSSHHISIYCVAFAGSRAGVSRLQPGRRSRLSGTWVRESAPSLASVDWSREARDEVNALLSETPPGRRWRRFGFGKSGGLFTSEFSIPNNLPAVFLRGGDGWNPLFENRTPNPAFMAQLGDYRPTADFAELMNRLRQPRLGKTARVPQMRGASQSMVKMLALLNDRPRHPDALIADMNLDRHGTQCVYEAIEGFGWITPRGQLTEAGKHELRASKVGLRRTSSNIEGNAEVYYPSQLR